MLPLGVDRLAQDLGQLAVRCAAGRYFSIFDVGPGSARQLPAAVQQRASHPASPDTPTAPVCLTKSWESSSNYCKQPVLRHLRLQS
jgi:hypothetical protein